MARRTVASINLSPGATSRRHGTADEPGRPSLLVVPLLRLLFSLRLLRCRFKARAVELDRSETTSIASKAMAVRGLLALGTFSLYPDEDDDDVEKDKDDASVKYCMLSDNGAAFATAPAELVG